MKTKRTLALLVGMAALALHAACGSGEVSTAGGGAAAACPEGQEQCGEVCARNDIDPLHCGACDNACKEGQVCQSGECAFGCSGGTTKCGGGCVDLELDKQHCGACAEACPEGQVCSGGTCGLECSGGATKCGEACVDTDLDPAHCGACDAACAEGEVCSQGQCGLACLGGTTKCGEACVDTDLDPAHCGACDAACAEGEVCSQGQCGLACLGGTTKCGASCVNTQNDATHCGQCDNACAQGEVCSLGQCGLSCAGGTQKCGSTCVNTQNDAAHCGQCDSACAQGEVCSSGQCGLSCTGGTQKCGNACVDLQNDPQNCGACGTACAQGEVCTMGACTLSCAGGTTKCGNACVNLQHDLQNCGACGTACAQGEVCSMGACALSCAGGTQKCGNACVDLQQDPQNCGGCGVACSQGETCTGGLCGLSCGGGTTKCGNACVDLQVDPQNCGACGAPCAANESCKAGTCSAKLAPKAWTVLGTTDACRGPGAYATVPDMTIDAVLDGPHEVLVDFDMNVVGCNGCWTAVRLSVDGQADPKWTHVQPQGGGDEDDHLHLFRIESLGTGTHTIKAEWGDGSGTMCNYAANGTPVWYRKLSVVALPTAMGVKTGYVQGTTSASINGPSAYTDIPEMSESFTLAEESVVLSQFDINWVGCNGCWTATRLSVDGAPDPRWTHTQPEGGADEDDHVHLFRVDKLGAGSHTLKAQWGDGSGAMQNPVQSAGYWGRRIGFVAIPTSIAQYSYASGSTNQCKAAGGFTTIPDLSYSQTLPAAGGAFIALTHFDLNWVGCNGCWMAARLLTDGVPEIRETHTQPEGGADEDDHVHLHKVEVLLPGKHDFAAEWGRGSGTMCNNAASNYWTRRLGSVFIPMVW